MLIEVTYCMHAWILPQLLHNTVWKIVRIAIACRPQTLCGSEKLWEAKEYVIEQEFDNSSNQDDNSSDENDDALRTLYPPRVHTASLC